MADDSPYLSTEDLLQQTLSLRAARSWVDSVAWRDQDAARQMHRTLDSCESQIRSRRDPQLIRGQEDGTIRGWRSF